MGPGPIPFLDDDHPARTDICFEGPRLPVGDQALVRACRAALRGTNRQRYEAAGLVRAALCSRYRANFVDGPLYAVYGREGDPGAPDGPLGLHLVLLPSLDRPARHITLWKGPGPDETLRLGEIWHASDPALGPVDPTSFLACYRLQAGDGPGHRAAIIEILRLRGARHNLYFPFEEYEDLGA